MDDKWIKQLKEQLDSYEQDAPDGLLDDIQQEMSRRGLSVGSTERKRKTKVVPLFWLRVAAIALICVIGATALYLFFKPVTVPPGHDAPVLQAQSSHTFSTSAPHKRAAGVQGEDESVLAKVEKKVKDMVRSLDKEDEELPLLNLTASTDAEGNTEWYVQPDASSREKNVPEPKKDSPKERQTHKNQTLPDNNYLAYEANHHDKLSSRWALNAYYGGVTGGHSDGQGGAPMEMSDPMQHTYTMNALPGLGYSSGKQFFSDDVKDYHHKLPIRVGVSVRYNLSPRWSVQTGVIYSYLASDISINGSANSSDYRQKLHFIGIPLSASYSIWSNRLLNVYVTAGGAGEKMVSGRVSLKANKETGVSENGSQKLHMDELQFSLNGAAGIELKATPQLSIYAEPGASYYIDNGSDIESYYSEHPWNFNLNMGVRINFNNK